MIYDDITELQEKAEENERLRQQLAERDARIKEIEPALEEAEAIMQEAALEYIVTREASHWLNRFSALVEAQENSNDEV